MLVGVTVAPIYAIIMFVTGEPGRGGGALAIFALASLYGLALIFEVAKPPWR